ncbi:MDIS1-interacting receptor like kinase 2-like [Magnolia sinica]|uniref:MDIS1-interacting receptor like kinase 2-like n=1 Tax=Magnolia sinica TaxID=86752 RepID=UPI002658226D|nr:MDIS1-interacting receptor like kinase 2-like [Magnolia sinica]
MRVTEKCDVYSFGIVALEAMMGRHPGELISSLTPPSRQDTLLKDMLDQRLPDPTAAVAHEVIFVVSVALSCIRPDPNSRPTMHHVAQELSIDNRSVKAITRKTTGMGRMRYLHHVPQRFKCNFREGTQVAPRKTTAAA